MDLISGIQSPASFSPAFLTLGVSQLVIGLLTVGFLACSVLLILTVLIQRPQGGGLSGAFGAGAGSGETAFGARTGDALTIATISFFVLWLAVAVGLVLVMSPPKPGAAGPAATSNEGPVAPGQNAPAGGQPAEQAPPAGGQTDQPAEQPTEQPAEQPAGQPAGEQPTETGAPADGGAGDGSGVEGGAGGESSPPAGGGQGG